MVQYTLGPVKSALPETLVHAVAASLLHSSKRYSRTKVSKLLLEIW